MDAFDAVFATIAPHPHCLIVVPPFHSLYRPSLGVHTLQACAQKGGFRVAALYANLLLANLYGESLYERIVTMSRASLLGERLFAFAAFGEGAPQRARVPRHGSPDAAALADLQNGASEFCSRIAKGIVALRCKVIGVSSTFEQTNSSVAILRAVKEIQPHSVTIIGGANCEAEMADGIASLPAPIDHIFSGECEQAFPGFLQDVAAGRETPARIIRGSPCRDLDAIPRTDFSEYFTQFAAALAPSGAREVWLPYETSRGCWWGEKRHCTFCGLNGNGMVFRQRSADRVLDDLGSMTAAYPSRLFAMTDNIMPHRYFQELVPRLAAAVPEATIFYEQKANLTLEKVLLLVGAGIRRIQPGIEALSSSLLRRMRKGVLARQNLALLRYCRSTDMWASWNLLFDFPGDTHEDYQATALMLPLLHHLQPPRTCGPLSIDRFSPYFFDPAPFGVSEIRPLPAYFAAFPAAANLAGLAYHFEGSFESAFRRDPAFFVALQGAVEAWATRWEDPSGPVPELRIASLAEDSFLLIDTRGLPGCQEFRLLNQHEAQAALAGGPMSRQPLAAWAIEAKLAVALDGWSVPLAVADPDVLQHFEDRSIDSMVSATLTTAEAY